MAYTQVSYGAEAFFIENEDGEKLIIAAENVEEAEEKFINDIYETSLYSDAETTEWLEHNPLYVIEVDE